VFFYECLQFPDGPVIGLGTIAMPLEVEIAKGTPGTPIRANLLSPPAPTRNLHRDFGQKHILWSKGFQVFEIIIIFGDRQFVQIWHLRHCFRPGMEMT